MSADPLDLADDVDYLASLVSSTPPAAPEADQADGPAPRSRLPTWGSVSTDKYALLSALKEGVDPADVPRVTFNSWAVRRWLAGEGPWPVDEAYAAFLAGDPTWAMPGVEQPLTIGARTAGDLRHGTPPDQLADPFLTAEGPTILYARGGTGKGLTACWLALRMVRAGHTVLVVDFEGHEREWGSRLRGMGANEAELAAVHYRAPFAPDWTERTGALGAVADLIRADAERIGATYLMVDSYSVATSNGDMMGGEAAAREYFGGLARIGLPSLTIAHVRGDAAKFPERPFGSVFVHNLARETWAAERIGDDEPGDDEDYAPVPVRLEIRNRKANARAMVPAQFVTFEFYADGTITVATDRPAGRSLADLAAEVLAEAPMTLAGIAKAITEDTGESVSVDSIRKAMQRAPRRFAESPTGRPRTWALR